LLEITQMLSEQGKDILISALSGTFMREPFEVISKMISKADHIVHLKSICYYCTKEAAFSLRCSTENSEILIGGLDKYKPVCRKCFKIYSETTQYEI
jgi:thymidine kinase